MQLGEVGAVTAPGPTEAPPSFCPARPQSWEGVLAEDLYELVHAGPRFLELFPELLASF